MPDDPAPRPQPDIEFINAQIAHATTDANRAIARLDAIAQQLAGELAARAHEQRALLDALRASEQRVHDLDRAAPVPAEERASPAA